MGGVLLTAQTGLQLDTILGYGTTVLTWFITSFGSIISFFVQNPALFLWFIVSLVGAGFVFFRKLV